MVKFGFAKGKLKSTKTLTTKSAFGGGVDDDADDDSDGMAKVNADLVRGSISARQHVKTRMEYQKALEEDATVFEYDEIYEDVRAKSEPEERGKKPGLPSGMDSGGSGLQESQGGPKTGVRKSRYVEKLLKGTAARKLEQERRNERILKRERDDEGDDFDDKEVFVTESYKKTLENFRRLDEEEKRKEAEEASRSIGGAGNLMNFYGKLLDSRSFGGEGNVKSESSHANPAQDTCEATIIVATKQGDAGVPLAAHHVDRAESPLHSHGGRKAETDRGTDTGERNDNRSYVGDDQHADAIGSEKQNQRAAPTAKDVEATSAADPAKVRRNTTADIEAKRHAYLERKRRKLEARQAAS